MNQAWVRSTLVLGTDTLEGLEVASYALDMVKDVFVETQEAPGYNSSAGGEMRGVEDREQAPGRRD